MDLNVKLMTTTAMICKQLASVCTMYVNRNIMLSNLRSVWLLVGHVSITASLLSPKVV